MKSRSRVLAAAVSMLCVTGCSTLPDVQFLASNTHFAVGGQHIVIPVVALRGPDHSFDLSGRKPEKSLKEKLKSEANDPSNPLKTDKLDLRITQYQYAGAHPASIKICPLLSRKWSQSLCRGEHRGALTRLPEKFDLLDRLQLGLLKNHWTVGRERKYDQVKDMAMQPGVPEIGCDRESRFCTAVVEVLPGLVAVWTVWSGGILGTAEEMAQIQGGATVQFVRRALGPTEDPTFVDAD
jgi:hypothetical protein